VARFRLARVLELRTQLRNLRRLELQRIEDERHQLSVARERLLDERESVLAEAARAAVRGDFDGAGCRLVGCYEVALRERAQALVERLDENQVQLTAKRAELGRERRDERKLEHLAERHRTRLESDAATAAERLLDELVLARHAREQGEDRRGT
jgi:flagellar export protein FliJ